MLEKNYPAFSIKDHIKSSEQFYSVYIMSKWLPHVWGEWVYRMLQWKASTVCSGATNALVGRPHRVALASELRVASAVQSCECSVELRVTSAE